MSPDSPGQHRPVPMLLPLGEDSLRSTESDPPLLQVVESVEPLSLAPVAGELRVRDTDLAVRLAFARPTKIRDLIKRHLISLEALGPLPTVGRVINGGEATEYWLNRRQAIFLTAKSETPKATEITIEIVERFEAYERDAADMAAGHAFRPGALRAPAAAATFKAFHSVACLIGFDANQAALAAARATRNEVGVDPLAAMNITHLLAPQQAAHLTASDIGVRLGGKSAIAVNNLLAERGLQVGHRDAKGRNTWEPTETGQPYAVWLDTGKRHGDGTPVRQLRWSAEIIQFLQASA